MNKLYKKFKKWAEQEKIQSILNKIIVIWLAIIILPLLVFISTKDNMLSRVLSKPTRTIPTPSLSKIPAVVVPIKEPTNIPSPTFTIQKYIAPTTDPDPIVNCNIVNVGYVKIKSSQCSISFACEIENGKWYLYTSRDKCTQDQNNYYKTKTYTYPTYSPLPTYAPIPTYSYQPQPTQIPSNNQAQNALNDACNNIQSAWYDYKSQFYATEYNNFSSGTEAIRELNRRRNITQSEADNAGCHIYLSL